MNKVNISSLYQIFERSPIGIFIWCLENPRDPSTARLQYCNKAAEVGVGFKPDHQYVGKKLANITPGIFDTEFPSYFVKALETGCIQHVSEFVYGDDLIPKSQFDLAVQPLNEHLVLVSYYNVTMGKKPLLERAMDAVELT